MFIRLFGPGQEVIKNQEKFKYFHYVIVGLN